MKRAILLLLICPQERSGIVFVDRTAEAGLVEPLAGMMGHGAAWGDFDGDGRVDLYVGGFCDRPDSEYRPASGPVPNKLLRNIGGKFEAVSSVAEFKGRTSGAVFADLDGDGDLDLYVSNNAVRQARSDAQRRKCGLFRNDGGKFTDVSTESGACPDELYTARNVGVFDWDGDGLLDLLVLEDKLRSAKPRSLLLRNKGGLKFEIANKEAGLPDDLYGLGLAVADLNDDRVPDFFVAHSNRLFVSKDGKYTEVGGFEHAPVDGEDWPCGAAFGDLNRDGLLDLVVTAHHAPARNRVFFNEGGLKFRAVDLGDPVPVKCPHVEIQDFDNDGWPDIYVSAAWEEDGAIVPLVYRNVDGKFVAPRPMKGKMVYFPAGPTADYDGDGRIDLFLVNWFQGNRCRLLRNESPSRHWLQVAAPIGARIRITQGGRLLGLQDAGTGNGYASGPPIVAHFGLGDAKEVEVEITLRNGKVVKKTVAADQRITP